MVFWGKAEDEAETEDDDKMGVNDILCSSLGVSVECLYSIFSDELSDRFEER